MREELGVAGGGKGSEYDQNLLWESLKELIKVFSLFQVIVNG